MYDEIEEKDIDENIVREINGIMHVDDTVDYDNLADPNQKNQYDSKIAGLQSKYRTLEILEAKRAKSNQKAIVQDSEGVLCCQKVIHGSKSISNVLSQRSAIHDTRRS